MFKCDSLYILDRSLKLKRQIFYKIKIWKFFKQSTGYKYQTMINNYNMGVLRRWRNMFPIIFFVLWSMIRVTSIDVMKNLFLKILMIWALSQFNNACGLKSGFDYYSLFIIKKILIHILIILFILTVVSLV